MTTFEELMTQRMEEILTDEDVRVFVFADYDTVRVFLDKQNGSFEVFREYFIKAGYEAEIIRSWLLNVPFAGVFAKNALELGEPLHVYMPKTGHHFYGTGFFMRSIIDGICTGFTQKEFQVFLDEIELINHDFEISSEMSESTRNCIVEKFDWTNDEDNNNKN